MTDFIVHALPAGEADQSGPAGRHVVADGPSPCRRCLRNAEVGDELILLPYDPFTVRSPYTREGAVYVPDEGCPAHRPDPGRLPEQVPGRVFSVRSYDEEAMMVD